jgi:BirA family biotin operon repressor/biotin-[acetyl-CoA-carboxylase] ligase
LGWRFASGIGALKGLSLLVGCVIVRVLRQFGFNLPGLKWPNDVLAEDKKLAGVLVEIRGDLSGDCELVIGIGLNYHMQDIYRDSISQPWIDLHELAQIESITLPSRNELVAKIIQELFNILDDYEDKTFNAYKAEWESYSLYHNKSVTLTTGESVLTGKCLGVDAEGAIIVEDNNKQLHYLHGGEVSLRSVG